MAMREVEEIYARHIKPLPRAERLQLLEKISQGLSEQGEEHIAATPKRSIMELHGLGKEIWGSIDAQEYLDQLRAEWDSRP